MNVTVLRHPRFKKRRIFGRASTTRHGASCGGRHRHGHWPADGCSAVGSWGIELGMSQEILGNQLDDDDGCARLIGLIGWLT